ncbi:MAG: RnfABCDGE type electron transport complex subunit B [Christensenellales bacterium]
MDILAPVATVAALGLLFGVLLGYASKKFAVEKDETEIKIRELLPGANCGGCGFPSCDALAEAVAKGKVPPRTCVVSSDENVAKMAAILGVEAGSSEKMVAVMHCQGDRSQCPPRAEYTGLQTCKAASSLSSGPKGCRFGCLGFGDCVAECKFGALSINEFGLSQVDPNKCIGCRACTKACPRNLLALQPVSQHSVAVTLCRNLERAKLCAMFA